MSLALPVPLSGAAKADTSIPSTKATQQAAPVKRSTAWIVQKLCALLQLGPGVQGAIKTKDFKPLRTVLDRWVNTRYDAKTNTPDVFPDLQQREVLSRNDWLSEMKEVFVYNEDGQRLSQSPLLTLISTDPVHVTKAMTVAASAYLCLQLQQQQQQQGKEGKSNRIVCGAPARLSRYQSLWFNSVISAADGTVWHHSLAKAVSPLDTLVLEMYSDEKTKLSAESDDVTPWLPVIALALYVQKRPWDVSQIIPYLEMTFPGFIWSKPMINVCGKLLIDAGF